MTEGEWSASAESKPPIGEDDVENPAPPDSISDNLPVQLTRFIGRRKELEWLHELIGSSRLVTVCGPGGIGKTRLALEAAGAERAMLPDGVWFIPLAAVAGADQMIAAIVEGLPIPAAAGGNLQETLLQYLRSRRLLLLLDNFEQLVPHANLLAEILQTAPHVHILVTSRERLNLQCEQLIPLAGLDVPTQSDMDSAMAADSAQLFLASARRVVPQFRPSEEERLGIARICHLVAGMPLALEMAGAWVHALDCAAIAREIEANPEFLAAGWADVPQRHQNVRTIFDHSWTMLGAPEQAALLLLSVFRSGFSREAASAVAEAPLGLLTALVDKSMIQKEESRSTYRFHPLIRHFAAVRLAARADEEARALERHAEYFAAFLRSREAAIGGAKPKAVLREIGESFDDIRAAWQWMSENRRSDLLGASAHCLFLFLEKRNWFAEGEHLFRRAAESLELGKVSGPVAVLAAVRLRVRQAVFLHHGDQPAAARKMLEACRAELRALPDRKEEAFCLVRSAAIALHQGDYPPMKAFLEQALSLSQAGPFPQEEADALRNLAHFFLYSGDTGNAEPQYHRALERSRALGDLRGESLCLIELGQIAMARKQKSHAMDFYERAMTLWREIQDPFWLSLTLSLIGNLHHDSGEPEQACQKARESLSVVERDGSRYAIALSRINLSQFLITLGAYAEAEVELKAALPLFQESGNQYNLSFAEIQWGCIRLSQSDYAGAVERLERGLGLAESIQLHLLCGLAHSYLGFARLAQAHPEEAAAEFQLAVPLLEKTEYAYYRLEAAAGLARADWLLGRHREALARAEEILPLLDLLATAGLFEPFRIHLTCHEVLRESQPQHAQVVLQNGFEELQSWADRIQDESLRRSFLENVPSNLALVRAYQAQAASAAKPRPGEALEDPLTAKELEILRLLAEGCTNQQIADRLTVTVGTVKFHVHNCYRKLTANNRTQAVSRARSLGLL